MASNTGVWVTGLPASKKRLCWGVSCNVFGNGTWKMYSSQITVCCKPWSRRKKKQEQFEQRNGFSFEEVARDWHASNKKCSETHRTRILQSLVVNIFPYFGKTNIKDLKARDLLVPIRQVAQSGRLEVAVRLQQQVIAIMRYAVQSGLNHFRWSENETS